MSNVFFISDLHLGHQNILKFSPTRGGSNITEHSEWLVNQWNSVVGKRDIVWVLGDVCFDKDHLKYLHEMKGQKNIALGNHDVFHIEYYQKYFNLLFGIRKKYNMWISHPPIHPAELWGKVNIHGHVHSNTILTDTKEIDKRYINACVEPLNGIPISIDEVKERVKNAIF